MQNRNVRLLEELRALIADLGKDGGKITPSIYDTAQRLRFYPPKEGVEPGLDWLLDQQQADGGWCDPAVPAARDAATLAAILALKQYRTDRTAQTAIEAGLAFLRIQAGQWADIHLDALPIAVEVVLPKLIAEANSLGFDIDPTPYLRLYALGKKKLDFLSKIEIAAASAPSYSWEAFDRQPTLDLLDRVGSVGHSPAATAKWLQLVAGDPAFADGVSRAEAYLTRAHRATDVDVPGVVPVTFPITGFELCYGPNALLLAGMLDAPDLQAVLHPQMQKLLSILESENGVSFGDGFVPDVDDTSVGMAALASLGYSVSPEVVMQFYQRDHFFTFAHELNPSVFSNAHALHALAFGGKRVPNVEEFLLSRQETDGIWPADKWHCDPRFTTLEVMNALAHNGYIEAVQQAVHALQDNQSTEGYWSFNGYVSQLNTAYTIMGLNLGARMNEIPMYHGEAIDKASEWLENDFARNSAFERRWLSKELYGVPRVDKIYILAALLLSEQNRVGLAEFATV